VILFLLGVVYVRGSFITMFTNTFQLLSKGGASGLSASKIYNPSVLVFIVTSLLFTTVVMATIYPRTGNIFYQAYLDIMPTIDTKGQEIQEGFLLEAPYDENVQEYVITRTELLQKLQGHLNRITLPSGISCSPDHTISVLAIEGYLKRLLLSTTKKLSKKEFQEWVTITHTLFSHVCEERKHIATILDTLHQDSRNAYSMNELRTIVNSLLKFYDVARVQDHRFRSRKEVNEITGLPIGELEPRNETALKGVNVFKLKTSIHDTGMSASAPTNYSDPFSYFSAKDDLTQGLLPTQTNELSVLKYLSEEPVSRVNTQTRGNNA
jgi:hypothetical protein